MYLLQGYQIEDKNYGGEPFSFMTFEYGKERTKVSIFGLKESSKMIVLEDERGRRIEPGGLVVARSLADKLDLKKGDKLVLKSITTGKKHTFKVEGIADLYVGNSGYMNIASFNKKIGLPEKAFIGLFSRKSLSLPESKVLMKIAKGDLIKAFEDSAETINQMLQMMAMISFLLSLTIIYVLSTLTIAENRKPLALFKILGYYERELSTIFLGFSNFSFVFGFLLGIPIYNRFVSYIFKELLRDYDFSVKMEVGFKEGLIVFLLLASAFVLSRYLGRRKIDAISPAVILKEQME
jgi:putative ABC transport system permease protein